MLITHRTPVVRHPPAARPRGRIAVRLFLLLSVLGGLDAHAVSNATYGCEVKYYNAHLDPTLTPLGNLFYAPEGPNGCAYQHTEVAPQGFLNSSQTVNALADSGTGLRPPMVDAQVFVTGTSLVTVHSRAVGVYTVDLVALGTPLNVLVPVFVSGSGSVSARATMGGAPVAGFAGASSNASASLKVSRGSTSPGGAFDNLGEKSVSVDACRASASGGSCDVVPDSASDGFNLFTIAILSQSTFIGLRSEGSVMASASGLAESAGAGATAFARVDPYVWIDPTFMVEVDGLMVPATQLFTLVASPGIQFVNIPDPTYVPLPAAIWQLGAGVLLLVGRAARRRCVAS